jgi:hypothetical protein
MTEDNHSPGSEAGKRSILINFVLDKSGSMGSLREVTISGFNEFKNDQAREEGEAFFTLTLFDTEFSTVCAAVPVREVPDLDYSTYVPGGLTALYDAIGHTLMLTDEFVALNKPDQVLFVIMTDGHENSSREYTRERIFQLIKERQQSAEYEFIYLGANQDSYGAGRGMGLREGHMMDWAATPEDAKRTMKRASHNVSAHRRHGEKLRDDFFSQKLEQLGEIDGDAWKAMSPEERKRRLDEGQAKGA